MSYTVSHWKEVTVASLLGSDAGIVNLTNMPWYTHSTLSQTYAEENKDLTTEGAFVTFLINVDSTSAQTVTWSTENGMINQNTYSTDTSPMYVAYIPSEPAPEPAPEPKICKCPKPAYPKNKKTGQPFSGNWNNPGSSISGVMRCTHKILFPRNPQFKSFQQQQNQFGQRAGAPGGSGAPPKNSF